MGAIVDAIAVIIAGAIGLIIKEGIPVRVNERLIQAIALCIIAIGISGAIKGQETLVQIISMTLGTVIGEGFDLDQGIQRFSNFLQTKLQKWPELAGIGEGFISASMLFCIGSMVIVGSLESGLTGNNTTLYAKAVIDGITALLLASSLGVGVIFGAFPVLIIEGGLTLFAGLLAPLLTPLVINEMIALGSIILIGLGLNMLEVTQLKIMNFVPAMLFPAILMLFM